LVSGLAATGSGAYEKREISGLFELKYYGTDSIWRPMKRRTILLYKEAKQHYMGGSDMRKFMDEDFLLQNDTACRLYDEHAKNMPIIDYHCHLSPKEIAENKKYRSITEVWLGGDHYKWRAMRMNGVDEKFITGDAGDREKFMKWAETMPYCIGNPLYHWTHLELKRFFSIDTQLSPETAEEIWTKCNEMLSDDSFSARELIKRSNVEVLCTTDDPADTLEYHDMIAADKSFGVKVLPTFRPDKGLNINKPGFAEWVSKLETVSGIRIRDYSGFKDAILQRLDHFRKRGCRLSDHSLEPVVYLESSEEEVSRIFEKVLAGGQPDDTEAKKFKTELLAFLGAQYSRLGWVMQIHMGCMRNNNTKQFRLLGPDTGFDAMDDTTFAGALSKLLDRIETEAGLPKTILYCLNPRDNEVLSTIAGCFQGGGIPGRIQFGSAWWFNDQLDGMRKQLMTLANTGLLSRFAGMLTDSRSFLSYTRHEYFRRILCSILGEWAENGEVPCDMKLLGKIAEDISYNNARDYFGFMA
jgi:glucuronate isomerase